MLLQILEPGERALRFSLSFVHITGRCHRLLDRFAVSAHASLVGVVAAWVSRSASALG